MLEGTFGSTLSISPFHTLFCTPKTHSVLRPENATSQARALAATSSSVGKLRRHWQMKMAYQTLTLL